MRSLKLKFKIKIARKLKSFLQKLIIEDQHLISDNKLTTKK